MSERHLDGALDAASLFARLPVTAQARIATLDVLESVDSTNSELLRRPTSAHGIDVLFAERQTGGRGRLGRAWASPPGSNLYLSLARCFGGGIGGGIEGKLAQLGGLSLVVGIAAAEALRALGADAVRVKWPNDIVVDDAGVLCKLGGVLIEGGLQDRVPRAVIGIGLNVRMPKRAADAIDQPWTDLHALLGETLPSRNAIAAAVLKALAEAIDRFDGEGLAPFLSRFGALDALRDADIIARVGSVVHAGVAIGLAGDGALRLLTGAGEILLHAGEVSVRKSAAAQA
jgi:BirA family transcriptional regulator, biotin operon repressor / biotin---[acetyl-CoA-carboxylase] ligase